MMMMMVNILMVMIMNIFMVMMMLVMIVWSIGGGVGVLDYGLTNDSIDGDDDDGDEDDDGDGDGDDDGVSEVVLVGGMY